MLSFLSTKTTIVAITKLTTITTIADTVIINNALF